MRRYAGGLAGWRIEDILDTFLRPVQIPLDLLGGLHAVGEVGTRALETPLRECLQLEQFAVFGVECTGAVRCVSFLFILSPHHSGDEGSHVCACVAKPLSSGKGSKAPFKRSLSISTRSMPFPWPPAEEDSYSPLALPL